MSTSDDIGGSDERRALVAEYVLGLLDPATHAKVERLVETDPAYRAERDFWIGHFGAMNGEYTETEPPSRLRSAIEARIFGGQQPRSAGWWNSLLVWRGISAAALAVAVAAVGFNLLEQPRDVSTLTTQLVAALEEEGSDVRFLALYDGAGTLRLTALSGETGPDQDLELWAIQGDNPAQSMGVVPVGQAIEVKIAPEIMAGWGEGSVLALTLEPKGGSPTGTATGPIVAKGAVTRI
jgi:anti-sigma-K factor RskA